MPDLTPDRLSDHLEQARSEARVKLMATVKQTEERRLRWYFEDAKRLKVSRESAEFLAQSLGFSGEQVKAASLEVYGSLSTRDLNAITAGTSKQAREGKQ